MFINSTNLNEKSTVDRREREILEMLQLVKCKDHQWGQQRHKKKKNILLKFQIKKMAENGALKATIQTYLNILFSLLFLAKLLRFLQGFWHLTHY